MQFELRLRNKIWIPLSTISVSVALCSTRSILPNQPSPTICRMSNSSIKWTFGDKKMSEWISSLFNTISPSVSATRVAFYLHLRMRGWTRRSADKHLPSPTRTLGSCVCEGWSVSNPKIHSSTTTTNDSMTPSLLCSFKWFFFAFSSLSILCWVFFPVDFFFIYFELTLSS